jgi:hypothetical protein
MRGIFSVLIIGVHMVYSALLEYPKTKVVLKLD